MPFPFSFFCDLLSTLERITTRDASLSAKARNRKLDEEVYLWFRKHRLLVDDNDTDGVALLSSLLPEKRSDRVYHLQNASLTSILGRCFRLGSSRLPALQRWKTFGGEDLGSCVERVLKEAPLVDQPCGTVTLEQIDALLNEIATRSRFSGPEIRRRRSSHGSMDVDDKLASIYFSLTPSESKWFTRMLLKDYSPVTIPEGAVLRCFHHLLPSIMKVHDSFQAALALLTGPAMARFSAMPSPAEARTQKSLAAHLILPTCGVKIGRPLFLKAWSVQHTVDLAHGRKMSLERKYDGEYCQVHIDLGRPGHEIQIFSKSGKDSTNDRRGVHGVIKDCLRLGQDDCKISQRCILEGELLLWCDNSQRILDFHKIRKHVDRSGVFLGTDKDSQPHPWEHLMVVFFDVMLVDDDPFIYKRYKQRRLILKELVTPKVGRADIVTSQEFDFSSRSAPRQLVQALASAFARRWEGYVLKPIDEPYVNLESQAPGDYRSCWIKLKKDKIPGLGDTAEFAVIGARYNPIEARKLGFLNLPWTSFYIGCLLNKSEVLRLGAKPNFRIIESLNEGISNKDMEKLCQLGKFHALPLTSAGAHDTFDFSCTTAGLSKMDVVFTRPFIFEVKGTGFDKPSNTEHFALRFPRVVKIHWDRDFKDSIGFHEFQDMAKEAMSAPVGDFEEDVAMWRERLRGSERAGDGNFCWWEDTPEIESQSTTQDTSTTSFPSSLGQSPRSTAATTTFVRMDTTEMLPSERRLPTGEVASWPNSSQSITTTGSTDSLSSPPVKSSPSSSIPIAEEIALQIISRKRSRADPTDLSPPAPKRCRTHRPTNPEGRPLSIQTPDPQREALSPLTNHSQHRTPATRKSPTASSANSKAPILPLSPHQSTSTTPQRPATAPPPNPPPSSSPPPPTSPLTTLPSPRLPTPPPPSFPTALTILSPCIATTPYITSTLLRPHHPHLTTASALLASLRLSADRNQKPVILLVESRRGPATARFLRGVLALGEGWGDVQVWDWRVLEGKGVRRWWLGRLEGRGGVVGVAWRGGGWSRAGGSGEE